MKEYTYTETEYYILQNLYYSMGFNRMRWHDYRELMIPSLKEEIKSITGYNHGPLTKHYNSREIAGVIRQMKDKFDIFGDYEGFSAVYDSIRILHQG